MKQLYEREGVILEIDYDLEPDTVVNSARVLDANYRATGPNLVSFLDGMFVLTSADGGSKFFSLVADELLAA